MVVKANTQIEELPVEIFAYKFRIYPTAEQTSVLWRWICLCRQNYNSHLLDRTRHYQTHKKGLNKAQQQTTHTSDKKRFSFLNDVPSQPLQETLVRLEKSFEKFFRKEAGYPKLKKAKDYRSLTFTQFGEFTQIEKGKTYRKKRAASFDENGNLLLSKVGSIAIEKHRPVVGDIKRVAIKISNSGEWFASFSVERRASHDATPILKGAGDVGIKKFLVFDNGDEIGNPKWFRKSEKKMARLQRSYARAKDGSKNKAELLLQIQQLHEHIANQRKDRAHKLSFAISKTYGVFAVENLKIRNMVRNRKLAKSIHDAGWGVFVDMLDYKMRREGGLLVKVPPHFTSVDCSGCGAKVQKSLSVRTHVCHKCGLVLDRDHNAALNILKKALEFLQTLPA